MYMFLVMKENIRVINKRGNVGKDHDQNTSSRQRSGASGSVPSSSVVLDEGESIAGCLLHILHLPFNRSLQFAHPTP